jgi:hypothetical protein
MLHFNQALRFTRKPFIQDKVHIQVSPRPPSETRLSHSLPPQSPFQGTYGQPYQPEATAVSSCGTLFLMSASSLRPLQGPCHCSTCNHHPVRRHAPGMAFALLLGHVNVQADSLVHPVRRARLVSSDQHARHVRQGVLHVMMESRVQDVAWCQ